MAAKSTIYKAQLNVADMDRQVYDTFPLTIACHPSETEARMMLRIVCFALHADPNLLFGRGISTDNEPDLWQRSLSNDIQLWIDLGTPDESRIREASGRAGRVLLYVYGDRANINPLPLREFAGISWNFVGLSGLFDGCEFPLKLVKSML